jgi:hypothetical protein
MTILEALEASAFSVWLRESSSIWAYPTVLTLHTAGLAVLVGASSALDLRLLGFAKAIPLDSLASSFRVMWIGFWLNAVTGVMLFAAEATTKGSTTIFQWKLLIIALAVVNIILLKRDVYGVQRAQPAIGSLTRLLAVTSLLLWAAAIATGRWMAYAS